MNQEFPLRKGARTALYISGGLCCLLIVAIPLGVWIFLRTARARVMLATGGVKATGVFTSTGFEYANVDRVGLCTVALPKGQGLAGGLAKARVGGDAALHLIVKLKGGKDRSFMVSSYEGTQEIIDEVIRQLGLPCETVTPGAAGGIYSAKWP